MHGNAVVYRDERYVLGLGSGQPYLIAEGKRYSLSCHPYEPCTYVEDESGVILTIHNAFDPQHVLEAFSQERTVASITGKKYGPREFCVMLAFAAERFSDTDISYVEGSMAIDALEKKGAVSPETAVDVETLGVRRISDSFSHSKKLTRRVMYTEDGRVWLRIRR